VVAVSFGLPVCRLEGGPAGFRDAVRGLVAPVGPVKRT
jgi:hypothetical protein